MKTIIKNTIFILLTVILSKNSNAQRTTFTFPDFSVSSTQNLTDSRLHKRIIDSFFTGTNSINNGRTQFDTSQMEIASYGNNQIQAIIVKQVGYDTTNPTNYIAAFFINGSGQMASMAVIVEIDWSGSRNNIHTVTYYDVDYNSAGSFNVNSNSTVTNIVGVSRYSNSGQRSWWSSWGQCIANGWNAFTSGNPANAAVGLACAYFAGPCVVGAALGCAASATFN
jgi:hypothetical protein